MRYNNSIGKRALSLVMAFVMLFSNVPVVYAQESNNTVNMNLGSYIDSVDTVYIYNSMYATDYQGELSLSAGGFVMAGAKEGITIQIGDNPVPGDENTQPKNFDINAELQGVQLDQNTVVVNQVYSGAKKVILTVTDESVIDTLILAPGAKLELLVNAGFTIKNLRLAESSSLDITVANNVECNIPQLLGFKSEVTEIVEFLETTETETAASETTETETAASETTETETAASETTEAETAASETTEAETVASETTEAETAASETTETETAASETTEAETAASETTETETSASETAESEPKISENEDAAERVPSSASGIPEFQSTEEPAVSAVRSVLSITNLQDAPNGDVTISAGHVTIGTGSVHKLTANGASISVTDTLFCAGDLQLTNTNLTGSSNTSVTASGTISVSGGKLDSMKFFGLPANVSGKIVFADSPVLQQIAAVGAPEGSNGVVTIDGLSTVSVTAETVTFASDFGITYSHNGTNLSYQPEYYRASYKTNTAENPKILGTISGGVFSADMKLPEFNEDGYTFKGWHYGESAYNDLSEISLANAVPLDLTTDAEANEITVCFDRGYQPDKYTHDNPDTPQVTQYEGEVHVGATIELPDSMRMGYVFAGWKVEKTGQVLTEDTHKILYSDLTDGTSLKLLAQWTQSTYNFAFAFGNSTVGSENIEISYNGGASWIQLKNDPNFENNILTFKGIPYGQTFDEYFAGEYQNGQMPILRDTRTDPTLVQSFSAWRTISGNTITGAMDFAYQESGGALDNRQDLKPSDYDQTLKSTAFTMAPYWGTMTYDIALSGEYGTNWSVLVEGETKSPVDGKISVAEGALVTFVTSDLTDSISYWKFTKYDNARNPHPFSPEWTEDGQYTFTMPRFGVIAEYKGNERWDTALGDYAFHSIVKDDTTIRGFTLTYRDPVTDGEGEQVFYEWNSDSISFFSSKATSHQISIDSSVEKGTGVDFTINMDAVQLTARENIDVLLKTEKLGYYITQNDYAKETANIYLINDVNETRIRFNLTGSNSIYSIDQKNYSQSINPQTRNYLEFHKAGDAAADPTLALGCIHIMGHMTFTDVSVTDAKNAAGEFIIWVNTDNAGPDMTVTRGSLTTERSIKYQNGGNVNNAGNGLTNNEFGGAQFLHTTVKIGGLIQVGDTIIITNSNVTAGRLNMGFGGGTISGSTVTAAFLGNNQYIHHDYPNLQIKDKSVVTIDPNLMAGSGVLPNHTIMTGIRAGRLSVIEGSKVTVPKGASMQMYIGVHVSGQGSKLLLDRLIPITKNDSANSQYGGAVSTDWSGTQDISVELYASRVFYMEASDGGKMRINNLNDGKPFGSEDARSHVTVCDPDSEISIEGDAKLVNRVEVGNQGKLTVTGNLYVANDLIVGGTYTKVLTNGSKDRTESNLTSDSAGSALTAQNIYGTAQDLVPDDGSMPRYYKIQVTDLGSLTAAGDAGMLENDGVVGSLDAASRTHVEYSRTGQSILAAEVIRDVLLQYSIPEGYDKGENPENIRIVNDEAGADSQHTLVAPVRQEGGMDLGLDETSWYIGDHQVSSWNDEGFLASGGSEPAVLYGTEATFILTAKPSNIPSQIQVDSDVDISVEYREPEAAEWTAISNVNQIPYGADVRITVPAQYEGKVVGAAVAGDGMSPLVLKETNILDGGKVAYVFQLGEALSARFYVMEEIPLYLNLSNIIVCKLDDRWGFRLTNEQDTSEETFFPYAGNFLITQEEWTTYSYHTLTIAENNGTDPQNLQPRVRLQEICVGQTKTDPHPNVDTVWLPKGGTVILSGTNTIRNIKVKNNKDLTVCSEPGAVTTFFESEYLGTGFRSMIGTQTTDKSTGTVKIVGGTFATLGKMNTSNSNSCTYFGASIANLILDGVEMYMGSEATLNYLASNITNLQINNCKFGEQDKPLYHNYRVLFVTITNMTVTGSQLHLATAENSNFASVISPIGAQNLIIDSSEVTYYYRPGYDATEDTPYNLCSIPSIELRNNSTLTVPNVVKCNNLTVGAGCTLNARSVKYGWAVIGSNLVNHGTINAGWVICSGYASSSSNKTNYLATNQAMEYVSSGTLTNSGTINIAPNGNKLIHSDDGEPITQGAVGGSRGAVITNSGTIDSPYIGTLDYKVGYTLHGAVYLPDEAVTGAEVNISGGMVQNTDTITAKKVNISGGTVQDFATITAEEISISGGQVEAADGKIQAPGGTVAISGNNTAVKVSELTAVDGSITIQNAAGTYDIPQYTGIKAGVYVENTMTAQSITISDKAYVYAAEAKAVIPEGKTGCLRVTSTEGDTRLYVVSFGASGQGADESSTDVVLDANSGNKNLYYVKQIVPIHYHLNGDATDPVTNDPGNPTEYEQAFNEANLELIEPERHGYDFGGWYQDPEFHTPIPHIDRSNSNPVHLYVKWIPKKVTFRVIIDDSIIDKGDGIAKSNLMEAPESLGSYDDESNIFNYHQKFTLDYGTQLQGGTGINLELLNLPAYQILSVRIEDLRHTESDHVDATTFVDKSILDPYLASGEDEAALEPYVLAVHSVQMRRANVYFYLNHSQINPKDAQFVSSASAEFQDSNTRASWVDFGDTISTGTGLADLKAAATGYTFLGWCSEQNPGENPTYLNMATTVLNVNVPTTYYAAWKANVYSVTFYAGTGGMITDLPEAPATHNSTLNTKELNVTYDSKFGALPYAWKEGYVFQGWYVGDKKIDADTVLNVDSFANYENLTVEAKFEPVKVTYHMMGGKWASGVNVDNYVSPGWGNKLPGYVDVDGEIRSAGGAEDPDDYRNTLGRKGYTFKGWYLTETDAESYLEKHKVKTILPYRHIDVYAAWSANTYTLNLNPKADDKNYEHTEFSHSEVKTATVTVGQLITGDGVSGWPDRTNEGQNWYVRNSSGDAGSNNRYLLGFTFGALDPGGTQNEDAKKIYQDYALMVTILRNSPAAMMEKGQSEFYLPEAYPVQGVEIPDYPDGSTIEMYAVYRERSLVFIEYYTDVDNQVQQKEMYATDYNSYSNYPYASYVNDKNSSYQALIKQGYSLIGWRFLTPSVTSTEYPEDSSKYTDDLKKQWVDRATAQGGYDLRIYTVYAAQTTTALTLNAKENPLQPNPVDTVIYPLPGGMQTGEIEVKVSNADNINLVTNENLQLYNTVQGEGNSDNTVAIGVKLIDKNSAEYNLGYLTSTGITGSTQMQPGAGWKIKFELYTTKVITQEQNLPLEVSINYKGNLSSQWIKFDDLTVKMVPTKYAVTYTAKLPNDPQLKVQAWNETWNEFDSTSYKRTESLGYGNPLANEVPELEGYTPVGSWYQTNAAGERIENRSALYGDNLLFPVTEADNGMIYVETEWEVNQYEFTVQEDVLAHWAITYKALNSEAEVKVTGDTKIPYHATVYFKPKDSDHAEFVRLKSNSMDTTLNLLEGFDAANGVSIQMGAEDLAVSYETQRKLYLEDGTISITDGNYTQNGKTVTWNGDYVILMDKDNNTDGSSTANVLNLNGTLADRAIQLGNLNITSDNSISLADKAAATLTAWEETNSILAENILVPASAALTMEGLDMTLTPAVGNAAVGGNANNAANGTIVLNDVDIEMTLPAGSYASGIGAATNDAEGRAITLNGSRVTVTQKSTAASHYHGAWIGGKNVASATLEGNTTLIQGADSSNHTSAYAVNAKEVSIENSTIGSEQSGIGTPIHAATTLTLTNSQIFQSVDTIVAAPIGTDAGGTINVTKTKVDTLRNSGTGELYTGTMKIQDADSEVVIAGTLILEMKYGDVEIFEDKAVQGGHTFLTFLNSSHESFKGSYLLLEELDNSPKNVTVNSISSGCTVTVKAPASGNVFQVEELKAENSINLILDGSTTMSVKKVSIAQEKELSVTGNTGAVQMADGALADTNSVYSQSGGKLESEGDIVGNDMDIRLTGVTATAKNLTAENLTLTDSNVTCENGAVGSYGAPDASGNATNVELEGTTTVTAEKVGALGDWNTTFTFVNIPENANIAVVGVLIRDWYRMEYKQLEEDYEAPDYTVFRTTQENMTGTVVAEGGEIPGDTIPAIQNLIWYYLKEQDPYALSTESTTVPGFAGNDTLRSGLTEYAEENTRNDGTKTLSIYAGTSVNGTVAVKKDRLFTVFESQSPMVTIPANGAWTALLKAEGFYSEDGNYALAFENALPHGTKLTLTVRNGEVPSYYYLIVNDSATNTVLLNDFTEMGGSTKAKLPKAEGSTNVFGDTMLLAADFFGTDADAGQNEVVFRYINQNGTQAQDIGNFTYTLTAVDGSIHANAETVTVARPASSVYAGKELALVAELTDESGSPIVIPYNASLTVAGKNASLLGSSRFVHLIGNNEDAMGYTVEGIYGSYKITWKLVLRGDDVNVLGNVVDTADPVPLDGGTYSDPKLKAWVENIDSGAQEAATRILAQGSSHTVVLKYETTAQSIAATVEKQNEFLANFVSQTDVTVTRSDGTVTVNFPINLNAGVYRICLSMTDSKNDNVYFTFVVME